METKVFIACDNCIKLNHVSIYYNSTVGASCLSQIASMLNLAYQMGKTDCIENLSKGKGSNDQ